MSRSKGRGLRKCDSLWRGRGQRSCDVTLSMFSQFTIILRFILYFITHNTNSSCNYQLKRNQMCKGFSWFIRNTQYDFYALKRVYSYWKQSPFSVYLLVITFCSEVWHTFIYLFIYLFIHLFRWRASYNNTRKLNNRKRLKQQDLEGRERL